MAVKDTIHYTIILLSSKTCREDVSERDVYSNTETQSQHQSPLELRKEQQESKYHVTTLNTLASENPVRLHVPNLNVST